MKSLKLHCFLAFFFVINYALIAQNTIEEKAIKETINKFFEGLHNGDTLKISTTVHTDLKLQTTFVSTKPLSSPYFITIYLSSSVSTLEAFLGQLTHKIPVFFKFDFAKLK